jgi:hypothetical protein
MALVKIARGIAVNPESFKYIALETKQGTGSLRAAVVARSLRAPFFCLWAAGLDLQKY